MDSPPSITVSSTIDSVAFLQKAEALAAKLNLVFTDTLEDRSSDTVLAYTPEGLKLLHIPLGSTTTTCLLFVDFVNGKNGYRLARNYTTKQALARAVGIKKGFRPTIFDATAGMGTDAFVLASLDCQVTLCERSELMAALLEDGLDRALMEHKTAAIVSRMFLYKGDAREFLCNSSQSYHTIYLDPMYPHRNQSALSKKPLRIIRSLVGEDLDSAALFDSAKEKAKNRVVVKRSLKAPLISGEQPSHDIAMKNSRFDVYLNFKS